jgi:hypothetical protein
MQGRLRRRTAVAVVRLIGDEGGEVAAGRRLAIPPDIPAPCSERGDQVLGSGPVLSGVADKELSHG